MRKTDTPTLRPIEELAEAQQVFGDWSALVRRLRPTFPEAIVFAIDAGHDDQPSVVITADTRTLEEGDITVILAKEWLQNQPELKQRLRQHETEHGNA